MAIPFISPHPDESSVRMNLRKARIARLGEPLTGMGNRSGRCGHLQVAFNDGESDAALLDAGQDGHQLALYKRVSPVSHAVIGLRLSLSFRQTRSNFEWPPDSDCPPLFGSLHSRYLEPIITLWHLIPPGIGMDESLLEPVTQKPQPQWVIFFPRGTGYGRANLHLGMAVCRCSPSLFNYRIREEVSRRFYSHDTKRRATGK